MKTFFLFLNLTLLSAAIDAQSQLQWQQCLGGNLYEHCRDIRQTSDNGYIVTGYTRSDNGDVLSNHGLFDCWVVKLDQFGSIQWEKTFGGEHDDLSNSIRQTMDGGYILAGSTWSDNGDISGNHGEMDAWVVKISGVGTIEWQKTLGGTGLEEANSVELTSDGGYIIAGSANSNDGDLSGNHGYLDFWIVKLNDIGTIEWQKCLGGSSEERALSIKQTSDSGYMIVGGTLSNDGDVSGNNGDEDLWVVKLNNSGTIEWENALGGTGLDVASDVVETSDGFVICGYAGSYNTGEVSGSHGHFDYWIVKLDLMGELLWQKAYGGSGFDYARSITKTKDGNFVITGETKSTDGDVEGNTGIQVVWVLKINDSGDLLWKKPLGGTQGEGCFAIRQTSDEGYILGGYTWSNDGDVSGNHGEADFWVVKLSPESSPSSEIQTAPLEVYPNPAQQFVSIKVPPGETIHNLSIVNNLGQEYYPQSILKSGVSPGELDVSLFPKGFYLLSATMQSGKAFCGKIIKQD